MTEPTPYPQQHPTTPPKKKRGFFPWFFLAVQILFIVWIIGGVSSAADSCAGETGDMLELCEDATAAGATIGVGLIIFVWAAVDVILGIGYLIFRRK